MSLALRFGRTLEELCNTMSETEWKLWLRFAEVHPWDGEWVQHGSLMAQVANFAGKVLKDNDTATPGDYMPPWKPKVEEELDPLKFFSGV